MREEKKKYLNSYLLQQAKISRLEEMCLTQPERKKDLDKKIAECKNLRIEIEEKIKAVDDNILSELLFQKYIFGKTLEETSLIINYSKRHTERMHIIALEKFEI